MVGAQLQYTAAVLKGHGEVVCLLSLRSSFAPICSPCLLAILPDKLCNCVARSQEDINALIHELNILRQVNHPNIVTLHGGCLKPPHIFLVEERMEVRHVLRKGHVACT